MTGVVVCPQVGAAEVGGGVLRAGGNAIDAAVATAFVQGVIDPPMAGLGGFGVLVCAMERGSAAGMSFSSCAGGRVRPEQWLARAGSRLADGYGYGVEGLANDIGYESVAVPGMVDGLGRAHARWGSLPWAVLLEPAIALAAEGFDVTHAVHDFWMELAQPGRAGGLERMTATPAAASLFAPHGALLEIGARCVQPELGRTLEVLAARGHREFYDGEIADAIARDLAEHGGHVTREDLASYRATEFDPLSTGYRRWRVLGAPPPSGGVMIAQMLRRLERHDLHAAGHNTPEAISLIVEAMRAAVASRAQVGADPDAVSPDLDAVLAGSARDAAAPPAAASPPRESADTTHVTIVDGEDRVVALTHSLGMGSGVVTPGLGFIYNNYMNGFNPHPGHVDSIAPGKRRGSSMAPTIILDEDGAARLAVGAPGATRITTAVLHSIVNVLDHGLTAVEAVSAPRIDCQGGAIEVEPRIPTWVSNALREQGYEVNRTQLNYDPYFARAQLVVRQGAHWIGASDPRRDGGAALYA